MKSVIYTICCLLGGFASATAQVGVNTESPRATLHIDMSGNTSGTANANDDIVIGKTKTPVTGKDRAYVGIGTSTEPSTSSAQLDLASTRKAFMPNKVALQGADDVATVLNPKEGMIVYNTNTAGGLEKGLHQFLKGKWRKMITRLEPKLEILYRVNTVTTQSTNVTNNASNAVKPFAPVKILDEGAYAFAVRLYGRAGKNSSPPAAENRGIYYIWLLNAEDNAILDVAEINPVVYRGTNESPSKPNHITYSVTLGAKLLKDQEVTIGLSHHNTADLPWEIDDYAGGKQNSFFYWRITSFQPDGDL